MHEILFNPKEDTPLVSCVLTGPKRTSAITLIFDTGCAMTQIRRQTLLSLGFRDEDSIGTARTFGVEGRPESGHVYNASRLFSQRRRFTDVPIGSFPMKYFDDKGIDGLLGWDIIRQFHLEMNGPKGLLKVF